MRNVLLAVFLIMFIPFPLLANDVEGPVNLYADGEVFSKGWDLTLTVLVDGQRSRDMVVSYVVSKLHGVWEVDWNAVDISTTDDGRVNLHVNHYSTREGSIRNVKVGRNTASFDIVYSGLSSGQEMHIVVPKSEHGYPFPEIRASRVYPSFFSTITNSAPKVTHKEEWEPIDMIILPSREIWSIQKFAESFKKK